MLNKLCLAIFVFSCCFGSVSAQTDFFWSFNDLNGGAVNADLDEFLNPGETVWLYLYYTTNGPADSDLQVGALLDIATTQTGVIRFTSAETFDFDIEVNGTGIANRWGTNGAASGPIGNVTDDFIDEWGAFTIAFGEGIRESNNGSNILVDAGYDAGADAFLFGRIAFEVIGFGPVSVVASSGAGQIVGDFNCSGNALDATFGEANFQAGLILPGDVNVDGEVNLLDVQPFVDLLSNGLYQLEADVNFDGKVDLLDVQPFVDLLSGGGGGEAPGNGDGGGKGKRGTDCLLGDVNLDGIVTLQDIQPFVNVVLAGGYQCEADINQDGAVNLLDVPCLIDILSG